MKTILSQATIIDQTCDLNGQKVNILIEDGILKEISKSPLNENKADNIIEANYMSVTSGFCDMWAHFNDPGQEHKEDISSGLMSAQYGGYTTLALLPNTSPVTQDKSGVSYLINKSSGFPVDIHPLAAVSQDCMGEQLTEMLDANAAGAIAFTDGLEPIWHTDLYVKALMYMQKFDGLLVNNPNEKWLSQFGAMHEGIVSTMMGLKGMPSVAEEIMVERDLRLLRHVGKGRIHFATISTSNAVNLIRQAKKEGLQVTCSVSIWNLLYTDESVEGYKTEFKLNPPLRTASDKEALINGVVDGTIDAIVSNHQAHDEECKKLEFDLADFGAIGLQTMLPCIVKLTDKIPLELLIHRISHGPRKVLGLKAQPITVGQRANLTLFDTQRQWTFDEHSNTSKSSNSPIMGSTLTGKVVGTFLGNEHHLVEQLP